MRAIIVPVVLCLAGSGSVGCGAEADGAPPETNTEPAVEQVGQALGKLEYDFVDITAWPSELDGWYPVGVTNHGKVLGQGFDCNDDFTICTFQLLERDEGGNFSVVANDFSVSDVSPKGVAGGCVISDPETFAAHAAVVEANGKLRLIEPLPGEESSCVFKVADSGAALVYSYDAEFTESVYILRGKKVTPFALADASVEDINDKGVIAGIVGTTTARAYRFDPRVGSAELLEPVEADPHSWGLGINDQSEVLGYSFTFSAKERIGKWKKNGAFKVAFVQGTPEVPTVSNRLIWNEHGTIVASFTNDGNTYLIPKPGVRLDLADLVAGDVPTSLVATSMNRRGDFIATSSLDGSAYLFSVK